METLKLQKLYLDKNNLTSFPEIKQQTESNVTFEYFIENEEDCKNVLHNSTEIVAYQQPNFMSLAGIKCHSNSLVKLTIQNCYSFFSMKGISQCENLKCVEISNTLLSDASALKGLHLLELNLNNNKIVEFPDLSCSLLKELQIRDNLIERINDLYIPVTLHGLDISSNKLILFPNISGSEIQKIHMQNN